MADKLKRPKKRGSVLSSLNMAIDGLNLANEFSSITPAKPVFGSVAALLTMIRVTFFIFCDELFWVHTCPGHDDQRKRLSGARVFLR